MQNEDLKYLLPDYITGNLDSQSRIDVEAQINLDPAFRTEYLRMKTALGMLEDEKRSAAAPPELSNLLIQVNKAIDSRQVSFFERVLKPKAFVPIALVLQAVTIVVILNVYNPDDTFTEMPSHELEEILQNVEVNEIALIEDYLNQDVVLADLPVEVSSITVTSEIAEDFNEIIEDQMFSDLTYEEVLSAGGSYLTDDELIAALPDQTFEKVLQRVREKSLL